MIGVARGACFVFLAVYQVLALLVDPHIILAWAGVALVSIGLAMTSDGTS